MSSIDRLDPKLGSMNRLGLGLEKLRFDTMELSLVKGWITWGSRRDG